MPVSVDSLERFLTYVPPLGPDVKGMPSAKLLKIIENETGCPYEEKTKSRPQQLEGLAFALAKRRCLLFYWMRLGKTKIALDWATQLILSEITHKKGLVITHGPSGNDVWEAQVAQHSHLTCRVVRSGMTLKQLGEILKCDCDLVIISHSTIQTLFTVKHRSRKGINRLYPNHELIAKAAAYFSFCVIDEIHLAGKPDGVRWQMCHSFVRHCQQRLGLTGTPVGRNPFAVWAQAMLIDDGRTLSRNYYFFEQAFGETKKLKFGAKEVIQIVFDKKKLPILNSKLASLSVTYGKSELKAAEVFAGLIELKLTSDQQKAYKDLIFKAIQLPKDEDEQREAFFLRMRQVASGYLPFKDEEGNQQIVHFDNAKINWLEDFLAEVDEETKVIIFHEYIHTGELICSALEKAKRRHVWLYGETRAKRTVIEQFQSGNAQFLVVNAATGGTSIDLSAADYMLFFESPCSPIVREQAQARPMSRGDRPLMMDDIVCAPVERRILSFLKEGRDLSKSLLGRNTFKELFEED